MTKGRRSSEVERPTTKKAQLAAGVDLGGTKIQTVVMRGGELVGQARVLTPQARAEDIVEAIVGTVAASAEQAGASVGTVSSLGIGFPGSVEDHSGRVLRAPNLPMFEGYNLREGLSRAIGGKPVVIDGDVRVAVVGEMRAGAGRSFKNFIGVFVGTGVGGGIIIEGQLIRSRGSAGEVGHIVVKDRGRRCGCGNRGCIEAYAGRLSMERTAATWVKRGKKTILFDLMKRKGRVHLSSGVFADALAAHDKMTERLIDEAVWALGVGLASAQNMLDFEAIIIGGGLGDRLGQPFIDRISKAMKPHLLRRDDPPRLLGTELRDLSGATGAALLAHDEN